jgi:hypothetical protein
MNSSDLRDLLAELDPEKFPVDGKDGSRLFSRGVFHRNGEWFGILPDRRVVKLRLFPDGRVEPYEFQVM